MGLLKKITFSIVLLGVFILLLLSDILEPAQVKINELNFNQLNKDIKISGNVLSIKNFQEDEFLILTLADSTGEIEVLVDYKKSPPLIQKNQRITVTGKLSQYQKKLQIQADKILAET